MLLRLSVICSFLRIYLNLFIHLPVDGPLGPFQFSLVINKAAMAIHGCVCVYKSQTSSLARYLVFAVSFMFCKFFFPSLWLAFSKS